MPHARPLTGPGSTSHILAFAVAGAAGVATLAIPGQRPHPWATAAALVVVAATIGTALAVPWQRLPPSLELTPALLFLVGVGLLRHGEGGASSGFGPLVVLPVLFVALHGSRVQSYIVVVASTAVFVLPVLSLDEVAYPDTEWRRAILWFVVGIAVAAIVQRLVGEIRDRAAALAALASASRGLTRSDDPRVAVCSAACVALTGDFAVLMVDQGDHYAPIAASGIALPEIRVPHTHEASGTVRAFASGARLFAPDAAASLVSRDFATASQIASAVFEPVLVDGHVVAVLVVGFTLSRQRLSESSQAALSVLADDAAFAMERNDLLARLREQATHDALTGAANRRMLDDVLSREVARAARNAASLSVAMIDLDHFKAFNDAKGHSAGDQLLASAAASWTAQLRPTDLLARYGGEEFAAVLVGARLAEAVLAAERLRRATPPGATCSIGVATWNGSESTGELLARADGALYRAKHGGRDQVAADPEVSRRPTAT